MAKEKEERDYSQWSEEEEAQGFAWRKVGGISIKFTSKDEDVATAMAKSGKFTNKQIAEAKKKFDGAKAKKDSTKEVITKNEKNSSEPIIKEYREIDGGNKLYTGSVGDYDFAGSRDGVVYYDKSQNITIDKIMDYDGDITELAIENYDLNYEFDDKVWNSMDEYDNKKEYEITAYNENSNKRETVYSSDNLVDTTYQSKGYEKPLAYDKDGKLVDTDMIMELHGYVEANPTKIKNDISKAIKDNTVDEYLKSKALMSDDEISSFKEKYNLNSKLNTNKENSNKLDVLEKGMPVKLKLADDLEEKTYLYSGKNEDGNYLLYDGEGVSGVSEFTKDFLNNKEMGFDDIDADKWGELVNKSKKYEDSIKKEKDYFSEKENYAREQKDMSYGYKPETLQTFTDEELNAYIERNQSLVNEYTEKYNKDLTYDQRRTRNKQDTIWDSGMKTKYELQLENALKEQNARQEETLTKPMENSYSGHGWKGVNFDSKLETKDIAKNVLKTMKEKYPDVKIGRKTDYDSITLKIDDSDGQLIRTKEEIGNLSSSEQLELIKKSYGGIEKFDEWMDNNNKKSADGTYTNKEIEEYIKNSLYDEYVSDYGIAGSVREDNVFLNDKGKEVVRDLKRELNSYNYDDDDPMTDYFNSNFFDSIYVTRKGKK